MKPDLLKIISLNIEFDRHLDRIIPFLKEEQPDVILLQEVLEKDIPLLEESTGKNSVYTVQNILCLDKGEYQFGMLTLSNLPILNHYNNYYRGDRTPISRVFVGEAEKTTRAISTIEIVMEGQHYCLMNTHFTWSPKGQPNAAQYQDLDILLHYLSNIPNFILCGDFNAPRGTAIFDTIASKYTDHIPPEVLTTIDKNLHKAGDLNFVVDGLFTTSKYQAKNVKVVSNLSDHCAIVATIVINPAY
jgi:endonuclease/exonuclease/phosphatase family metal-dependent hydrolase